MCAAPALHAVRSELLGEGGLCVRPVHSPVPAFLSLARPRADPSGAAARVAGRVPSSGSTAPTGVAAVVVVTVAALPWCDGGVEHRRRDRGHGHTPRPRHAHEPPSPAPATLGPAAAAEQSRRPAMATAGGSGGRRRRRAAAAAGGGGGDGGWWWSGPDGASRGSPAVLSRRLGGLEPARASVGPTRRRAEQRCDTACEPRSSRPPGRLLVRTPTTATERFGWFSTSPRASEKRIDAAS